jgi:Carboxypeptidase regulatory-like domain
VRHIQNSQQSPGRKLSARIHNKFLILSTAIACLALISPRPISAQASAGMTGTVTDTSGAVVPNANVTVTNQGTSVSDKTVTSSAGTYSFKGLPPGRYDVNVEAAGFKKAVKSNVTVEVSTAPTVDLVLAAGATNETVQVSAETVALNTTQPEMGSTIEPVVVQALPNEVNGRGRQIDQLQFLAPGTTGTTFSHRVSGGVDFEQEIVYNGIPAPQPETEGYTTNFNPPFDLVQEYRVERSTFSAQYGLGQGALTYQTASGTNTYHGNGFWINRNSFFDSVGFFNGPAWGGSNTPPTDRENNYGFTLGGPIWIPKVYDGHNKTFGHISMEWYKQNNLNTNVSTVPTALEKTGDFSDFVNGSTGALIPIYVPQGVTCGGLTPGQQFPGNVIPASCISPTSQTYIQYIPNPDRPGSGIGGLDSNKSYAPFINPHIQHDWGFTLDHNITSAQSLHWAMWRNTFSEWNFDNNPLVIAPNPLNSMKYEPAKGTVFLLNYNWSLSPHLVMTAGAGWIGEINNQFNETKYNFPAIQESVIPPYVVWDGQHTLTKWGTQGSWLQSINRKLGIALDNNWLWTKGRHTFNIGLDFRRSYQDDNEDQTEGGQFSFSQRTTSVPNTSDPNFGTYGSAFASFLLGIPDQANRANNIEARLRNWLLAPYIQDDIKLTPKLTVNAGLRWDIQAPFTENSNNIVFFNPDKPGTFPGTSLAGSATKFGSCDGCAGFDRADIHWGHFGPRLGFAYELNQKTVLQGGFSIAFLNGGAYEYGTNKVAVNYNILLVGAFTRNSAGGPVSSYGSWDTNLMPNPVATPFNPGLGAGTQINAFSRNDGFAPYSEQWNVNLQRELGWNTLFTGAYVGNRVIHLPSQNNEINQMNPTYDGQYGDVIDPVTNQSVLADKFSTGDAQRMGFTAPYANFVNDFGGSSTVAQSLTPYPQYSKIFNNFEGFGTTFYNSAQIQVEKRFTNGLSFLAGYTLSHLMDNTSSGFSSFTTGGINKYNQKPEWTTSAADERNTLKVSGTYELPIGPGQKYVNNQKLGNLVGGWQIAWFLDYEAGTPISGCSNSSVCENGSPFPNGFNRPDRNSSVGLSTASYNKVRDYFVKKIPVAQMWNPAGFTLTPTQYVIGNANRIYGELKNPAYYMENLNATKHFYIGERVRATLRVDYFNAFNRTQFEGPNGNASQGTFGQVTSQGSQISNRQGQVQVKVEF